MTPYDRNQWNPAWEPIPWDAKGPEVDEQETGFRARAVKPLIWWRVDWRDFPKEGVFGHDRDWFVTHNIAYVTTYGGEDLVLIDRDWFGWPDPPRWGLASRPEGRTDVRWQMWGSFPDLPDAWLVPEPS